MRWTQTCGSHRSYASDLRLNLTDIPLALRLLPFNHKPSRFLLSAIYVEHKTEPSTVRLHNA